MSESEVLYSVEDRVATATINRPERRNAMSYGVMRGLRDAVATAKADDEVRVLVLTGAGDRAFCAGADLGGIADNTGAAAAHDGRGLLADLFRDLWSLGKPTIARVRGYALAGGFGLALACDFVIAANDAQFGTPEVDVGLWPYLITVPLLRSMPAKKVFELQATGRRVHAAEAERIGFVTRVVPPRELDYTVESLAGTLANKSPLVLRWGRDAFYRVLEMEADPALDYLQGMLSVHTSSEDAAEGVAAFAEKRKPAMDWSLSNVNEPEVRYTKSGDISIAYMTYGEGPMDLVYVPGFISHCDLIWEVPFYRQIITRLGTFARVITFDKRGTGLSDRTLGHGSVAERTDDIRAVMDAAGVEAAALIGLSEGGPLCLTFAAAFPERVRALVLWGTFPRILESDDYTLGVSYEPVEKLIDRAVEQWGRGVVLRTFVSDMPQDEASNKLFARYERSSATPTLVGEVLRQNATIDVRAVLSSITAPTLVLHRKGDRVVPLPLARYVAEHIKGAQLVELPGDFHVTASASGELDSLGVIEEFLTGTRSSVESDRVLATVLFTDIVDSTSTATELGDKRWTDILRAHDEVVRRELGRFGGREVETTGDGFLAVFESPARAIRSAQAILAGARAFGVEVRAGLHTGECELYGSTVAGVAVHIGARVCALAGPGEVLVTSTVRDLVMGSDIGFEDRGTRELKGVPGDWHILAVKG